MITKDKRLKAMHDLHLLLAHDLNCGDLRSLNGLLEFVLVVMCLRCNWMAGMYEGFQAVPDASPCITKLLTQSVWRWITRLPVCCAASFGRALGSVLTEALDGRVWGPGAAIPCHKTYYFMTSDASLEGAKIPGMGAS